MNVAVTRLRSRPGIALAVLLSLTAALLLVGRGAAPAPADLNPSNMICKGHTSKAKADPDDPSSGVIQYTFACSQPISGYMIQPDKQATGFETEVFGADPKTKDVIAADAFSCAGEQPGYGVNCTVAGGTGATAGNWDVVTSTFTIDGDPCVEPRTDPLLIVTYAAKTANGAQQYIAGPFDLGRPRGCAKSARNGKWRIPPSNDESTIVATPAS